MQNYTLRYHSFSLDRSFLFPNFVKGLALNENYLLKFMCGHLALVFYFSEYH